MEFFDLNGKSDEAEQSLPVLRKEQDVFGQALALSVHVGLAALGRQSEGTSAMKTAPPKFYPASQFLRKKLVNGRLLAELSKVSSSAIRF